MSFPPPSPALRRSRRLPSLVAVAALTLVSSVAATPSVQAQRSSFEGSAARAHDKNQEERRLDLNGDGKVDDQERGLAFTYLRQQIGMDDYGEVNEETRRTLRAKRKQLQAEARAREKADAALEKLREKQAKGRTLTETELAQIRATDAAAEAARREREQQARETAKAPTSPASQMLSKPIIDADRR